MRAVVGVSLVVNGIESFRTGESLGLITLNLLAIGDGPLLIAGLWTPVAGSLVVIFSIGHAFAQHESPCPAVLLATIGAGLALVGPGTWSLDAWLFGWKKIDLQD
jgi:putative oxidoreductase